MYLRASKLVSNAASNFAKQCGTIAEHVEGFRDPTRTTIMEHRWQQTVFGATQSSVKFIQQALHLPDWQSNNGTMFFRGHWHLSYEGDDEMIADASDRLGECFEVNYGRAQIRLKTIDNKTLVQLVLFQDYQDETVLISVKLEQFDTLVTEIDGQALIEEYSEFSLLS